MFHFSDSNLTWTGKLKRHTLEKEYADKNFAESRKFLSMSLAAAGVLFALFIIPQAATGGMRQNTADLLTIRVSLALIFFCAAAIVWRSKHYSICKALFITLEILYMTFYLLIIYLSGQLNYLLKCLDTILFLAYIFMLPTDLTTALTGSALSLIEFFSVTRLIIPHLSTDFYFSGMTYVLLMYLIFAIISYISNAYKRRHFLDDRILRETINYDYLTGAFSRIRFDRECDRLVGECGSGSGTFTLAVLDIDDFKRINDTFGHLMGDHVLTGLSALVRKTLGPGESLTRWGGEEFIILYPGSGIFNSIKRVEELREIISAHSFEGRLHLTCSFGVVEYHPGESRDLLIDRADKLMYSAKNSGKNMIMLEKN